MPPKRRRIVNPSAQPGLGRRYLNEKFSTLPSSSAELKKGHVLQLYISKAGRSVTETERQLRKHFSFEGFSFRNSLNAAIKRILRLTVKKLNKLTAPTEFAKFSAICDEGFDLFEAVDPEFTVPVVSPSMLDEKITFEQTDSGTMTRTPHSNLQGHSEPGSSARSRSCQGDPLTPQKDKMKVGELSGQLQTPRRCTNQSIQTQRESQVTDFPGHVDQVFQQLNYQRLRGQLCDCVIVVGNRHFKAHRAVLAACSTHFRALFSVAESNGGMNVIQLDSEVVTAEALSVLVDMMYTSTLMLEESNVMDVLLAASHLHLNSVVKACKHYLSTRTLHLSLPGKRYMHCSDQHAAGTASSSRLQHPFLQQYKVLPIKVKEEAEQEEQQQPQQMQVVVKSEPPSLPEAPYETSNITCQAEGSDQTEPVADKVEQRASLPIRRFHKRKQSLPLVSPGDQPKRRPRLSSAASEEPSWVRVVVETVGEEGEFFSPDSHRVADESKHDTDMAVEDDDGGRSGMPGELYRSQAAREDAQVSGRSDSGVVREQGLQEKEEYSDILQKCEVLIKVKEEVEEQQPQQMHVVVKSEAPDETNNVTSWAEGSDQAEPVAVKAEISPQSSVRSFSDTHSDTDCIPETHCSSGGGLVVLAWVSGATAELLPKCHWMGVPGSIRAESCQIQDTISSSSSSSATICDALLNIPSYEGVGGH